MKKSKMNTSDDLNKKFYQFRIVKVKDLGFQNALISNPDEELDLDKLNLSFNWDAQADRKTTQINIYLKTKIGYKSDDRVELIVSYTNVTTFEITNFEEIALDVNEKTFHLHSQIIKNFIGISISTVRGILIEKLANTNYKSIILPAIGNEMLDKIISENKVDIAYQ